MTINIMKEAKLYHAKHRTTFAMLYVYKTKTTHLGVASSEDIKMFEVTNLIEINT